MCTSCVSDVQGGQQWVSYPGTELQIIVNHHVSAGITPGPSGRVASAFLTAEPSLLL